MMHVNPYQEYTTASVSLSVGLVTRNILPELGSLFHTHAVRSSHSARLHKLRLMMMAFGAFGAFGALDCAKPCPRLRMSEGAWTGGFPVRGDKNFETGVCETEPQAPECYPEGERCSRESPTCGPDPTPDFGGCYNPSAPRKPASLDSARALSSSSTCSHDGECGLADYGKRCDRYRVGPPGPSVYNR